MTKQQDSLRENIEHLREVLEESSQIEERIRKSLSEVNEIRRELETFLETLNKIRVDTLQSVMNEETDTGETGSTGISGRTSKEQMETSETTEENRPGDPTEETGRGRQGNGSGRTGSSDTGQQEEANRESDTTSTRSVRDEPVRAGEFPSPGESEYSFEEGEEQGEQATFETSSPVTGTREQKEDSHDEGGTTYQRRMIQKDPRLKDLPEEVKDTIADVQELIREAERGIQFLDSLSVKSRSAQIAIWAGKARLMQNKLEGWKEMIPSEFFQKMHVFFGKLTTVTRDTECEWIDALKRSYDTDWERYIEEQERKLQLNLQREERARDFLKEPPEERKKGRKVCRRRLRELTNQEDPDPEEVRTTLTEGMDLLAFDDPAVQDVAEQFSDFLREDETFEPLLDVIDEKDQEEQGSEEEAGDQFEVHPRPTVGPSVEEEVLQETRGKRAVVIGGDVTGEWKRRVARSFEFKDFDWFSPDQSDMSVRDFINRKNVSGCDIVFLMKSQMDGSYSRTHSIVSDLSGPDVLIVEQGVGVAPIRDAISDQVLDGE